MVVLGYFNRGWSKEDGGLLQLWRARPDADRTCDAYRWDDYVGRRLSFLTRQKEFRIELQSSRGRRFIGRVRQVDQVAPTYNRVVICDFQRDVAYHSVSPSGDRARNGFLQWLY